MVGEEEDSREVASSNRGLSQQKSRGESRDPISQHINSHNEYPNEDENESTPATPIPTPNSTDRESTANVDDIKDSITLRAPPTTASVLSQAKRQPRPPANSEDLEGEEQEVMLNRPPREGGTQRPQRTRRPVDLFKPAPWKALVARTIEEPRTLADALASPDSMEWKKAWDSEVESLKENGTWVLEELPLDRKAIRGPVGF